jgi:hypothetical protein
MATLKQSLWADSIALRLVVAVTPLVPAVEATADRRRG